MTSELLVTCIMPTCNRRRFVSQAIFYFLRQDYAQKELIVVDDGEDAVSDLIPSDDSIRYVRLDRRRSVGAKRNLACELARGELIAHWDDDDWMAPDRLSEQVAALTAAGADLCGAQGLLHYHLQAGQAWLCRPQAGDRPWLAGCTLLYRRTAWQAHLFVEDDVDASGFVARFEAGRVQAVADPRFYIALLHSENTTARNLNDPRWQRRPFGEVSERLGEDRAFYVVLRNGPPAPKADIRQAYPVSCIMPTYNRRAFVPQAIRYFLRQDYPWRELIVVDDGSEPAGDLIPRDERIRYIRLPRRYSIGEKRNLACEAATGEIIVLWDDDDWYAPHRISYQVLPLLEGKADVTGLDNSLLLCMDTGQFWACTTELHERIFARGIVSGTLAFWKGLWTQAGRFPDSSLAEDATLMWLFLRQGARVERLANDGAFVYVRHGGNTWRFDPGSFLDSVSWLRVEAPSFMSSEDLEIYDMKVRPQILDSVPVMLGEAEPT